VIFATHSTAWELMIRKIILCTLIAVWLFRIVKGKQDSDGMMLTGIYFWIKSFRYTGSVLMCETGSCSVISNIQEFSAAGTKLAFCVAFCECVSSGWYINVKILFSSKVAWMRTMNSILSLFNFSMLLFIQIHYVDYI